MFDVDSDVDLSVLCTYIPSATHVVVRTYRTSVIDFDQKRQIEAKICVGCRLLNLVLKLTPSV